MDSSRLLGGLAVGAIFGLLAVFVSWLLGGESSPFYDFFLHNVGLRNVWMLLNFPAFMALVLVGARSFEVGLLTIFGQWFIIGFLLSLGARKLKRKLLG